MNRSDSLRIIQDLREGSFESFDEFVRAYPRWFPLLDHIDWLDQFEIMKRIVVGRGEQCFQDNSYLHEYEIWAFVFVIAVQVDHPSLIQVARSRMAMVSDCGPFNPNGRVYTLIKPSFLRSLLSSQDPELVVKIARELHYDPNFSLEMCAIMQLKLDVTKDVEYTRILRRMCKNRLFVEHIKEYPVPAKKKSLVEYCQDNIEDPVVCYERSVGIILELVLEQKVSKDIIEHVIYEYL